MFAIAIIVALVALVLWAAFWPERDYGEGE